jgi:hypothetical protein
MTWQEDTLKLTLRTVRYSVERIRMADNTGQLLDVMGEVMDFRLP